MERAKAERKVARRLFSTCASQLEVSLKKENSTEVAALVDKLLKHHEHLEVLQGTIMSLWIDDEERDQDAMDNDIDTADVYDKRYFILREQSRNFLKKHEALSDSGSMHTIKTGDGKSSTCSKSNRRHLKLPKFELPVFDGDIKNWIGFWSQFKKIHEDQNELSNDDKMHYLVQAIEKGTSARDLIESFPPCGENYQKAIQQLKERFAKDELIIDHYVRELLNLVVSKKVNKLSVRALYDRLMTQILALESLGLTQDKYACFLYPLVESALPEDILKAWHRSTKIHTKSEDKPLQNLLNFVKLEVESEERIRWARLDCEKSYDSIAQPSASCLTTSIKKESKVDKGRSSEKDDRKEKVCVWCQKGFHSSSECTVAMKMNLEQRKEFLKQNKACFICLTKGHSANFCRKFPKCVVCGRRHYAIMCGDLPKPSSAPRNDITDSQTVLSQSGRKKTVLLQTLKVNIKHDNKTVQVRALLDSGTQMTFIKSDVIQKLKMRPIGEEQLSHNLFGGTITKKRFYKKYNINVYSLDGKFGCNLIALEQTILCGYLPKLREGSIVDKLVSRGVCLTDCIDDESEISLLIGSDFLGTLLTGRSERVDDNLLVMETKLGWTIQALAVGVYCSTDNVNTLHASCSCDTADFWQLELLGIKDEAEVKSQKVKESEVQTFFENTIRVNDEGRYEVQLPWKDTFTILESNYNLALKRLTSISTRLTHLGIIDDYDKVFKEWLDLDIIEEVVNDEPQRGHYIPHHAVVRESSTTTKIRPVFDASATDKNGYSLNSCLEKGTNLIELIPKLLIQFRKNKIGITADIKKAFLQISLHPHDRDHLKFLWWRDINESPRVLRTFRHRRVVFGVTTSPYLLSATILYHLRNYDCYTANKLRQSYYVDNCVVSVGSTEEMYHFIEEAKKIMLEGKFELRCWVTGPDIIDEEVETTSVLGLIWNPHRDELTCKVPSYKVTNLTKRFLLSVTQSIFDPLGFLCPVTIVPKLIIQKCWVMNLEWDQTLPEELREPVKKWLRQIDLLRLSRIPRRLSVHDLSKSDNSLHVFCDGSQSAYASCIFLRSEYEDIVSVQLVFAKARVAPTKAITIPRIELLAGLMASRLANEVRDNLELINYKEFYWTDSSIVLAWIKKGSGFNVFVQNRVTEIVRRTNVDNWHHIPGELNPADLPSRGCSPQDLLKGEWWRGPDWLTRPSTEWPLSRELVNEVEVSKELTSPLPLTIQNIEFFSNRLLYFSSYRKIVRMVGWCLRFAHNCHNISGRLKGDLSMDEVQKAEICVVKVLQSENFNNDVIAKLRLEVFKDANGLLRVKTRLTLSGDTNDFTMPILLPGTNIVERLVAQRHKEYLHAGSQTLQAKLRESFWIIGCRKITKRIVRNCIVCKRFSAKVCNAPIPPLPADRVRCGVPFEVTGIDFAGPLFLRTGEKCWICLFTCATYRAVHLELCLSLSTEEFLLALRRFLARRGNIKIIYTDNGTNFRGASNVLNNLNWTKIENKANKIQWRFIPPAAPWWGGFWERMVRTVKQLLRRVLGKAMLRFGELFTVICEVESIINSRPLTYIADDSELLQPLTPASFLNFSKASGSSLDIELIDGQILSSRWRYIKKLCADLKQSFRDQYLSTLVYGSTSQRRVDVKPGDVVLLEDNNKKRVEWPLGLVIDVFEGVDGHRRVVKVRTAAGERIRAIQAIYPLELSAEQAISKESSAPSSKLDVSAARSPTITRSGRLIRVPEKLQL